MLALDRKVLRDLFRMRGAALAIALVMACGVAAFVVPMSTLISVEQAQTDYYAAAGFPDVFVALERAPTSLADRLAAIPGVARVETRLVRPVTLDMPDLPEPASGRLISLPDRRAQELTRIWLRSGRLPRPERADEVVAVESFAEAHGLGEGDRVRALVNGRLRKLVIVGIALSPEYVFTVREGELLPDAKRFGVFWMPYAQIAAAFDMDGAFNSAALAFTPGASAADRADVLAAVDGVTAPYGGLGAYGRENQVSHRFLTDTIGQLRAQAETVPAIFLGVTAFLLQMVVARLVATQRAQIATLKAFGYSASDVTFHYLQLVTLITLAGAAVGVGMGAWFGTLCAGWYATLMRFPVSPFRLPAEVVAVAVLMAMGTAIVATVGAIRRATRVPPAEAMRPEPPAVFRVSLAERIGWTRVLPTTMRMILRHLGRRPLRSLMTATGVALAVAVLVTGNFVVDTLDFVSDFQFARASRQSMTVAFVAATGAGAATELAALPGVRRVESFRAVAARLSAGHRARRVALTGLGDDRRLSLPLNENGRAAALPAEGLLVSRKLAERLGVTVGGVVHVDVLEGERPSAELVVGGVVDDIFGLNAYLGLDALWRLMREAPTISGAHLLTDPAADEALYRALKQAPRVAAVTLRSATREAFDGTFSDILRLSRAVNLVFAMLLAVGVVYNMTRIMLAERGRDLATLRVLGFTRGEVSAILLGELGVLVVAALVPGLAIGHAMAWSVTLLMSNENFRFPLVISGPTYAFAVTVTLIAAAGSAIVVRRKVDALALVDALKAAD
jgi:putative ABC transport system permease protein